MAEAAPVVEEEKMDEEMKDETIDNLFKDDIVSNSFRGRIRQIISFKGTDGLIKEKETVLDSFAAILVRVVGFKDLYEAWEEQYQSTIDGFKENEKAEPTLAKQKEFLE